MTSNEDNAKTSSLRDALFVRLRAFVALPHTRVYSDKRFYGLGAGLCALGIVVVWPDAPDATVTDIVAIDSPQVELGHFHMNDDAQRVRHVTLKRGDNLGPLLQREGLSGGAAHRVTQAFGEVVSPKRLRAGQTFHLSFDDKGFSGLAYKPSVERTVFVNRVGSDTFAAHEVAAEFEYQTLSIQAEISNSLYLDATRLGAPDRLIQQFANIYEYSVDFQRDIRAGDAFTMYFEAALDRDGDIVKSGDLLFTSFSPRGRTSAYYLYNDGNGDENYYDADGKTAKRKLRATPVNGARLSSGFGKRRHPVLGYAKMHKGVDFAAPRGTPVLAAGSGTVERANRYGSFGNYIRIRHTDGYKTAYAHLKGFARGVKKGARVTQDQVIGYVGTTGRSTGPHLHYEVHHNGKAINPRKLAQLSGKPLAKSEMEAFAELRARIDEERLAAPIRRHLDTTSQMVEALN